MPSWVRICRDMRNVIQGYVGVSRGLQGYVGLGFCVLARCSTFRWFKALGGIWLQAFERLRGLLVGGLKGRWVQG